MSAAAVAMAMAHGVRVAGTFLEEDRASTQVVLIAHVPDVESLEVDAVCVRGQRAAVACGTEHMTHGCLACAMQVAPSCGWLWVRAGRLRVGCLVG